MIAIQWLICFQWSIHQLWSWVLLFFFVAVGYVFVDLGVSEMLLYVLFDVDISEHDDGTHIFVCPDRDEFYMIRKVAEG